MAKSISTKSNEEKITKSLVGAAKILNKKMHAPHDNPVKSLKAGSTKSGSFNLVTVYQVYCTDQEEVISNPTTNLEEAKSIRDEHDNVTGHISKILASK